MNKILLTSLLTLLLSTSLQASAYNDSNFDNIQGLSRPPEYATFHTEDYTLDNDQENSLFNAIEDYLKEFGDNSAPVCIYLDENIVKDNQSFEDFAKYLNGIPFKDLTLIIDPVVNNNVTEIGPRFCFVFENSLTSFSAKGFDNLQSIRRYFLYYNKPLKTVDLSAFTKVTSVEPFFLYGCSIEEVIVANEAQRKIFEPRVKEHNPNARFIIK